MKQPPSALLAALAAVFFGPATLPAEEFRTLTNVSGKSVRAKVLAVSGGKVSIELENGQAFEVALDSLSPQDRESLSKWSPSKGGAPSAPGAPGAPSGASGGGVSAERINAAIGQPLFGEGSLWASDPGEVAERLGWPRESKTAIGESYRAYPGEEVRFLGARPHSAALYGEDGVVASLSIVFANKGDSFRSAGSGQEHFLAGKPVPGGMEGVRVVMGHDAETIAGTLTELLGEPVRQRFGEGESRVEARRWDWAGHAFLLSHVPDEYVALSVQTVEAADKRGSASRISDATIRERARGFVERRENGDVVITNIPMVDQGPKGYCVPATAERCMRFMGIPADMYLLAMAGETQAGGGTSVDLLLSNIGSDIKRKGRSFEASTGPLKMRDIKRSVDAGIPIIWTLHSTERFNETANERTAMRKESWDSHVAAAAAAAAKPDLGAVGGNGHVVILVGYNEATNEIAFSDSWGERYLERWITLPEAELVSQQRFYVIGL